MSNPVRAYKLADAIDRQALSLPAGRRRDEGSAASAWLRSASLLEMGRSREALDVSSAALTSSIQSRLKDSGILGDLYLTKALAATQLGQTEAGLRGLQKAYDMFVRVKNVRSQAIVLQNLGSLYIFARDYQRAADYYNQSASLFPQDLSLKVSAFANKAYALRAQGKFDEAIVDLQRALDAARRMRANTLEKKLLCDLASTYLDANDVNRADSALSAARRLPQSQDGGNWASAFAIIAARSALMHGNTSRAEHLIEEAIATSRSSDAPIQSLYLQRTAYRIFKATGDNKAALAHLEQFKKLDDQETTVAASAQAALISARFDFANQNLKITQLRATALAREAAIARAQARFRAIVLVLLLAAAGVISTLLLIGFLSTRRSRNQVRAANAELSATNTELEKALAARTEFLATTSHEIRTPLNGILGMTQVLLADRTLQSGHREQVELVHGAGRTMRALVDDILDVAKMAKGELTIHMEAMDLHGLLREAAQVWDAQARAKGVSIVLERGDSPGEIMGDAMRLRQILFNLMSNAVKFTDRGAVTLSAEIAADRATAAERLRLRVSDTGLGIPPDRLDDIFESFRQVDGGTTRRHGGTGLGLAICRSLAQAMGGTIAVDSVLGAGACFTVDLPLERVAYRSATARAGAASLAESRLLLLDANPLSRSVLQALLAPQVRHVHAIGEAADAGQMVTDAEIDLMVADGAVFRDDPPQAVSVLQAAAAQGGYAVLLLADADEAVGAAVAGMARVSIIRKPVTGQDLVSAVKSIYKAPSTPAEIAA